MAEAPLFQEPETRSRINWSTVAMAGGALVVMLSLLIYFTQERKPAIPPHQVAPLDAYAGSIAFGDIALSEADTGTGGKSTYIDGVVKNNGSKTLTGLTVQTVFHAEDGSTAGIETLPLPLIRTREPYIDLQPISAAPVAPGQQAEFRLIFENVPANWDVKAPEIRAVRTNLK